MYTVNKGVLQNYTEMQCIICLFKGFFKGLIRGYVQINILSCRLLPEAFEMWEYFLGVKKC